MKIILNNIRSVHNVGSIFRTADALGVEKIFLCGITPSPIDRFGEHRKDFQKTALGSEKTILWEYCKKIEDALAECKNSEILALEINKGGVPYFEYKPKNKNITLVVGSEVEGLSEEVLANCNQTIYIPMKGKKESLNVSVALGIVAYHLTYL